MASNAYRAAALQPHRAIGRSLLVFWAGAIVSGVTEKNGFIGICSYTVSSFDWNPAKNYDEIPDVLNRYKTLHDANLDLKDEDGDTPLSAATQQGRHEVTSFLVAWLSHQHCLIRHRVGATYATLPVDHKERALYHFAYGKNKVGALVVAEDAMLPRGLLPDDLFPLVVMFLVGDGRRPRASR